MLSSVKMIFLMSFTTKTEIQLNEEEVFSPECLTYADETTGYARDIIGFDDLIDEYNYWVFH